MSGSDSSDSDSSGKHKHGKVKKDKKDKKDKDKKDKKDKKSDKKDKHGLAHPSSYPAQVSIPTGSGSFQPPFQQQMAPTHFGGAPHTQERFQPPTEPFPSTPPPSYGAPPPAPPPSGFRIPLDTASAFPSSDQTGWPPTHDADGVSPIFIGSALMEGSVHPCKIGPHLSPPALVPFGGKEYAHHGRFDLLPFKPDQMEWVYTSHGNIPPGRKPIEGGYEDHGGKLYHALADLNGLRVPGKTGEHLGGCNVAFGGREHAITENYQILCWK